MPSKQDIIEIFERLEAANPNPKSELSHTNEFTFAVAVILSAQTTDKAVNKVTQKLFEIADTPEKILAFGLEMLKAHLKSLGLSNSKAKNIIAMSQFLVSSYNSKLPQNRDELEELPGIGRKSANVIANRLFGEACIAVDTHVLRVAVRLGLSEPTKNPLAVEIALSHVVPIRFHKRASDWLVLHGRYVCVAINPRCTACLLGDLCKFNSRKAGLYNSDST
ncbi:MAG: endonuclease III [Holosporales bacterium]|jgi:endonuclease-3|nr:endonuclease III [Holosporales bacterium]